MPLVLQFGLVAILSVAWFFVGIGHSRFIQTEVLRALVAREMYDRGDWMPTVHQRPYIRKLPLHAWTTATLADLVGRFDEQVARWPSAAMGVIYVLAIYGAALWLVDPRAGPAAAVLAAGNWEVLDYATRADLDAGVLAWTTLAVVLLAAAWMARGTKRYGWLAGCYAAALIGSYWKAPHVLATVWLALIGLYWMDRSPRRHNWRRIALDPIHLALAAITLAAVAAWELVLSSEVGGARAGKFVVIEALVRIIPRSPRYFLGIVEAFPTLALVTFPASAFAAVLLSDTGRQWLREHAPRAATVCLSWLAPTSLLLLLVPAKSGRYWFLCMGAVTILGALVWRRYVTDELPQALSRACTRIVHGLLVLACIVGLCITLLGVLAVRPVADLPAAEVGVARVVCLVCGLWMVAIAGCGWLRRASLSRSWLGGVLVLVLLAVKPVHALVVVPARAQSRSTSEVVDTVESLVPNRATVFVLSDKPGNDRAGDMSDVGYYCDRKVRWPINVERAFARTDGPTCYLLVRPRARRRIEKLYGDHAKVLAEVSRYDETVSLIALDVNEAEAIDGQRTERSRDGRSSEELRKQPAGMDTEP